MLNLFYAPTPNGMKIKLFLNENKIEHNTININIKCDDQFNKIFLDYFPNNKIPAIIDIMKDKRTVLSESGAILVYLADKYSNNLSKNYEEKLQVMHWLFWQVSGMSPILGQYKHFFNVAKVEQSYAKERFATEAKRIFKVLDGELFKHKFLGSDGYSVADMSAYPWIRAIKESNSDIVEGFSNIDKWFDKITNMDSVKYSYKEKEEFDWSIAYASDDIDLNKLIIGDI